MSSSFSAKCLSLLLLKLSTRWGFSPWACQMRRTVASLMPISAAMVRVLQWVALDGLDCVVLRTTSALSRTAMAGLRPLRGASLVRPSRPKFKNRLRHRAAFWLLIRRAAAISKSVRPAAAKSTTLARSICRAGREREPAHCFKVAFWEASSTTGGAMRISASPHYRNAPPTILVTIYDAVH